MHTRKDKTTKNITKAMILAAGEGSRLKQLTSEIPKPLLLVGEKPIIAHQLSWLKYHGITEVAINLHHFGKKIQGVNIFNGKTVFDGRRVLDPKQAQQVCLHYEGVS